MPQVYSLKKRNVLYGFSLHSYNQRIWEYGGKKIHSFEDAERVAFEVFEEHHTTQEEREFRAYGCFQYRPLVTCLFCYFGIPFIMNPHIN